MKKKLVFIYRRTVEDVDIEEKGEGWVVHTC